MQSGRFSLEHRLKAIGAEAQGQPPAGQRGSSGGKLPPLNLHPRTRRSAGCAEVIRLVARVHVLPRSALSGRNGVVEPRILQNQGRRVPAKAVAARTGRQRIVGRIRISAHAASMMPGSDRQAGAGVFNAQMPGCRSRQPNWNLPPLQ